MFGRPAYRTLSKAPRLALTHTEHIYTYTHTYTYAQFAHKARGVLNLADFRMDYCVIYNRPAQSVMLKLSQLLKG